MKTYLGDGLYATFDGYRIWLTAEDGIQVLRSVYLAPEVFMNFIKFAEKFPNFKDILRERG